MGTGISGSGDQVSRCVGVEEVTWGIWLGAPGAERGLPRRLDGGEDLYRLWKKAVSRRSQAHATGVALEQHDAELVFQVLDAASQGGLGEVQALGGAPEGALLGHSDEALDLFQRHACTLTLRPAQGPCPMSMGRARSNMP